MPELYEQIQAAQAALEARWQGRPRVGIILGTGLGGLAEDIRADAAIPYEEIPYFPTSTVKSHAGRLVCGTLGGKTVMAMEGRFHFYEGYTLKQLTFPVRVMKAMGCDTLIVSNACGGMNPQWARGDIMLIEDHINLLGDNPLIGKNDDRLGLRFPDMTEPYDRGLLVLAQRVALEEKINVHKGVFVAVSGPNLETRAEYRFLRGIGADVVGMSTVPEVIVGVHSKMRILGFSVVTDLCLPDALQPVSLEEVIAVATAAEPKLRTLVPRVVEEISRHASAHGCWRDIPALVFCLTFPALMTWIYLVVLAGPGETPAELGWGVRLAYGTGKVLQFTFPALYVAYFERERLRPTWPTRQGLTFGLVFGVLVGLTMLALYFGWLEASQTFVDTPRKVYRLVHNMHCDTPGRYVLMAAFITVPHALLEEYYWRWFVFGWLRRYLPLGPAVALSAVGFMAHHTILLWDYFPGQFWSAALPFSAGVAVGGAVWAWIYARSASLYAPWVSHILVDAALMAIGWAMLAPYWAG